MCVSEYVSITLGDALFTASPGITSYIFLVVRASVFCICDIPLFSSDTLTLRKDHHQKLLRICDFVVCLPSGGFIFLLPVWNGIYCVRGTDFASSYAFDILELFRQNGIFFHFFTMAIQKNNWKKPDYKERKTWTSTSDEFRES